MKNALEYLDEGMPVAIEKVWSPQSLDYLISALNKNGFKNIKWIRLKCELVENHRRDEQRVPENQMKDRVDIVNLELETYDFPPYVHLANTTKLTVEDTLGLIEQLK